MWTSHFKFERVREFFYVGVLALAAFGLPAFPAAAQDLQTLIDRIERLERDIRTLNVQIARGDSVASTVAIESGASELASSETSNPVNAAYLDTRITALENDLRSATGSVEELGFQINQLTTRIDKLVGDVDFRLSELEQRPAASSQPNATAIAGDGLLPQDEKAAPQSVTPQMQQGTGVLGTITAEQLEQTGIGGVETGAADDDAQTATSQLGGLTGEELAAPPPSQEIEPALAGTPETEVAALTPQDEYAQAFALLRQAKYEEAANALQAFVDRYAEHDLTANARYWLGETYYVRSEFVRAAEIFFEAYRISPQGAKAPDTLLKLGMALGNLGKQPEACAAFAKLTQEFPKPSSAIVAKLDRERARNGCQVN